MGRPLTILALSAQLATAEAALARYKAKPVSPDDLIQLDAACDEGCPQCRLKCAIMVGVVEDDRRLLADMTDLAANSLYHDGRFFIATEGRA